MRLVNAQRVLLDGQGIRDGFKPGVLYLSSQVYDPPPEDRLHLFFGVERKEVNPMRFTWQVLTIAKGRDLRPMMRFVWEWDTQGQWLKLCNLSALNDSPHLIDGDV